MGVYSGLRRRHIHEGARLQLSNSVSRPKQGQAVRQSSFANIDTYDERQRRQADGLRGFAVNDGRCFLSDATLRQPYSNIRQVAAAIRGVPRTGNIESFSPDIVIRSNRFEELPDWMGRMQVYRAEPKARQRVT